MGAGAGETPSDEDYTPLVPQVRVRVLAHCASVAEFIEHYHRYVQGDRIFIATDVIESIGNLVQFRVDLSDGTAVVHGTGTVLQRRPLPQDGLPPGLVLRFVALDEASAGVIDAMSVRRAAAAVAGEGGVVSMEAPPAGSDELHATEFETRLWTRPAVDATGRIRVADGTSPRAASWRTERVEPPAVLPANPLGDVPEAAITYFIDWSMERNGNSPPTVPAAVAFQRVRMQAPRRPRRRPPSWLPFVVGVATGCGAIFVAADLWRDLGSVGAQLRAAEVATRPETQPPAGSVGVGGNAASPPARSAASTALRPTVERERQAPGERPAPGERVAAMSRAALVSLAVACDPGAQLFLDGQRVGHTPALLHVPRGSHVVELQRPRYRTARVAVEAPGRAVVHLERPRATLRVTANVAEAEVYVDGEPVGRAPVSVEVAAYERALVEVRAPGVADWHKRVYVKPPTAELRANFAAE